MIWLSFVLLFVSYIVSLFKTSIGLRIRAVGEHPRAADTVGIDVYRTPLRRGGRVGHAGSHGWGLPFDRLRSFVQPGHDRGPGLHRPGGADLRKMAPLRRLRCCICCSASSALRKQIVCYSSSSYSILSSSSPVPTLPYVLTLVAVAGVIGRSVAPAADGLPYVKQ